MDMEKDEIKWLKDILRIDSTLDNEKEVADYLEKVLNNVGIETKQIEYTKGRNQLIATLKGSSVGKKIGLTGHMDVVPVGVHPWKHAPFAADEVDGKIYARGASDMKAGLMAFVAAMIQLKNENAELKGEVELLATVGEETSAIGAGQLVKLGYGNDLDALLIGEPTDNRLVIAHKGALWLRLKTKGKTAHGSMPSAGINAVEHMLIFLEAFRKEFDFSQNIDELVGSSTSSIDVINGGKSTNVIPDECIVEIDIRTIATQNHDKILAEIETLKEKIAKSIPDFNLDIEVINNLNSVRTNTNDDFVKLVTNVVSKFSKEEIQPIGLSGYTDGSQFVKAKKQFPIIILGPGETKLAHQPDENVEIDKYLESIEIYKSIIRDFLS